MANKEIPIAKPKTLLGKVGQRIGQITEGWREPLDPHHVPTLVGTTNLILKEEPLTTPQSVKK